MRVVVTLLEVTNKDAFPVTQPAFVLVVPGGIRATLNVEASFADVAKNIVRAAVYCGRYNPGVMERVDSKLATLAFCSSSAMVPSKRCTWIFSKSLRALVTSVGLSSAFFFALASN